VGTILVPPIKSQGIKTKLVNWINETTNSEPYSAWVEPFCGTGVVAFNVAKDQATLADSNPHLIRFYRAIAEGEITAALAREFLELEGKKLLQLGESHYYAIRDRFNETGAPLGFLFLNCAGFNGMIRFNKKGKFNIPFCRKPQRFAPAYVTKIVNQIDSVARLLKLKNFSFVHQDFLKTIQQAAPTDMIYCDPPYIDRHADYFNGWDESKEIALFDALSQRPGKFILSTWHHNDYRSNDYIKRVWNRFEILTSEHQYFVGANESNRNPIVEALVTNIDVSSLARKYTKRDLAPVQYALCEPAASFG